MEFHFNVYDSKRWDRKDGFSDEVEFFTVELQSINLTSPKHKIVAILTILYVYCTYNKLMNERIYRESQIHLLYLNCLFFSFTALASGPITQILPPGPKSHMKSFSSEYVMTFPAGPCRIP